MQVKNPTKELKSFVFTEHDSPHWVTVEPNGVADVPEEHLWRALAHGFVKVGEIKPKGNEVKDLKISKPIPLVPANTKKKK